MTRHLAVMTLMALLVSPLAATAQNAPPPRGNGGGAPLPTVAVSDPGPRPGSADAGSPLGDLDTAEWNFFLAARDIFSEVTSVSGTLTGERGRGLGPRFNHTSCAGCHSFPAVGGSSGPRNSQIEAASAHGARNIIPSFITATGPVRVARFVRDAQGQRDGGVHSLFVITGRSDAPDCGVTQPNFAVELNANNVVFRIPTPLFGLGLVENTPDANLRTAFASNPAAKASLGVSGHFNISDNDGSILRFGWKAQNKSLMLFSGEAFNVEQGVTNEVFPNEREETLACQFGALPEDGPHFEIAPNSNSAASAATSRTSNVAAFSRLLAAPTPVTSAAAQRGAQVFTNIGCHTCHVPTQITGRSQIPALDRAIYHPYSDFALHDMGQRLNDGISQGNANGADWRTAPLWGLGQRLFFLHDGRTSDLVTAITTHASPGSEANTVVDNFVRLSRQDLEDLLTFLRSL